MAYIAPLSCRTRPWASPVTAGQASLSPVCLHPNPISRSNASDRPELSLCARVQSSRGVSLPTRVRQPSCLADELRAVHGGTSEAPRKEGIYLCCDGRGCSSGVGGGRSGGGGQGGDSGRSGGGGDGFSDGRALLLSGAVAFEVKGASRRNYSVDDSTGDVEVTRVNSRETHGRALEEVRLFFLPEGFPDSVGPSYAAYSFWRCAQNVISAMTAVMSTQALLSAVGIGRGASQSVAAATSWVLKDGFGSVGKLITARMGVAFDSESKMYRLFSDLLFDVGISLELVTPLFPRQFLALAAAGNFIKSVSMTIGMACRNSILATFVLRENLGDISAKNDAQNTIANLTGLALGIGSVRILPESTPARLAVFWALTTVYSVLNYLSMKSVTLRTLNRQRAAIVTEFFLRGAPIPPPTYANRHERIIPFLPARGAHPSLRLGAPLSCLDADLGPAVRAAQKGADRFILDMDPRHVNVVLHRDASADDLLEAYLAYGHLRRALRARLDDRRCAAVALCDEGRTGCTPTAKRVWAAVDPAARFRHIKESRAYARKHVQHFKKALEDAGYSTHTLLFAPDRIRAVF